jgi:hypothetical protein
MPPSLQQSPFHEAIRQGETELAQTFPVHARETKVISHSTDSRMPTDALSLYAEPPENSSLYDNESLKVSAKVMQIRIQKSEMQPMQPHNL